MPSSLQSLVTLFLNSSINIHTVHLDQCKVMSTSHYHTSIQQTLTQERLLLLLTFQKYAGIDIIFYCKFSFQTLINFLYKCRYSGYYKPPWSEEKYEYDQPFWHIWFVRLVFVVCFQTAVSLCVMLLRYLVPDVPASLRDKIR